MRMNIDTTQDNINGKVLDKDLMKKLLEVFILLLEMHMISLIMEINLTCTGTWY